MTRKLLLLLVLAFACFAAAPAKQVKDYKCPNGWTYTGEMKGGKRHGQGFAVTPKGNVYSGIWQNDKLPYGTMRTLASQNQSVYEGPLNSGFSPHGFGHMRYTKGKDAGCVYIGNYSNGTKEGFGKFIDAKGRISFGIWKNGELQKPQGQKYKHGDRAFGIDLSHHNPNVDWKRLALYADESGEVYKVKPKHKKYLQPVSFAFIRATEGATVVDGKYVEHMRNAKLHHIPRGSYHLMSFTTSTVEDQVANFLRASNYCKGDELPPVLDLESKQAAKAGKKKVQQMVEKWLKEVEAKTGRKPIIYTNDRFINNYLDMSRLKGYVVWKASYGYSNSNQKKKPQGSWHIWQFTEKGHASGISPVDINEYDGSVAEFEKKFVKKKK